MDLYGIYFLIGRQILLFLLLRETEGFSEHHISSESGSFHSPNHPMPYPTYQEYTWNITAPEGFVIILNFRSFDIEESRLCEYDSVQVLDGTDGSSLGVFCGRSSPNDIQSSKNKMIVKFTSDGSIQKSGFLAFFRTEAKPCARPDRTWLLYEDHCYKTYPWTKLTWNRAKNLCQDNGANLATINSAEEGNFLRELLKMPLEKSTIESNYWIGMRANDLNSSYERADDSPIAFTNWDSDDNTSDSGTCVSVNKLTGLWIKTNCSISLPVVCKIKKTNDYGLSTTTYAPRVSGFCPDGWFTFGIKCYKVFGKKIKERQTWFKAQERCTEINSTLVSIRSKEEQEFLTLHVLSSISFAWIGMRLTYGLFKWSDGSIPNFTYWGNNQPSTLYGAEEECVLFQMRPSDLGGWHDYPCSFKVPYICEIFKDPTHTRISENPALCMNAQNWLRLGANCYKTFNRALQLFNWQQAQRFCRIPGGSLATITNFAVSKFLSQNLPGYDDFFWIGMKKMNDNEYAWIGSPSLNYYSNWIGDEPPEVSNQSNCVAVNRRGEWVEKDCLESHAFMCEVRKGNISADIIDDDLMCPNTSRKWKDFGTKLCYIVEWKRQVNRYDAQNSCRREGGDLAIFSTSEELDSIQAFLRGMEKELHIGMKMHYLSGDFKWVDGSTVDYNIWAYEKSKYTRKPCVQLWTEDLYLYDYDCSKMGGFICSTPKISEFKTTAAPAFTEKVSSPTVPQFESTLSFEGEKIIEETDVSFRESTMSPDSVTDDENKKSPEKFIGYLIPVSIASAILSLLLLGLGVNFLRKWYTRKFSKPDVHVRLREISDP